MSYFSSLDLSKPILKAVASEGYETPTPIQAEAIPPILDGRDLLGCAQTGTGKTAAFALPILDRLHRAAPAKSTRGYAPPRALILSPTRELASQIGDSIRTYGKGTRLRHTVIYGGVKQFRQVRDLDRGVDVIIATPGRLLDLMEQGYIDLRAIEVFVLDEADRMLDMGFIQPITQIASELPDDRQTLLFSATMPRTISRLADTLLDNPARVSVTPVASSAPAIKQSLFKVAGRDKPELLTHLLDDGDVNRAVVFVRTKHGADRLTMKLTRSGISAASIHGNKSQNQRQRALDAFRAGSSRVLVATDVAARGLDVDGITHVFNFDLPNEPEAYVHRIGRTGRAGATGIAVSFCARDERNYLRAIERLTGTAIETLPLPKAIESAAEHPRRNCTTTERPAARGSEKYGSKPNARRRGPAERRRKPKGSAAHGAQPCCAEGDAANPPRRKRKSSRRAGSSTAPERAQALAGDGRRATKRANGRRVSRKAPKAGPPKGARSR